MDHYLISYDFRVKIEDCRKHGYLISTEEYIADIQQLLEHLQGLEDQYQAQLWELQADLEGQIDRGCDCITGSYDEGKAAGRSEGYESGYEEGYATGAFGTR